MADQSPVPPPDTPPTEQPPAALKNSETGMASHRMTTGVEGEPEPKSFAKPADKPEPDDSRAGIAADDAGATAMAEKAAEIQAPD